MKIRKVVSTVLIAAMLFFAPSMIPVRAGAPGLPCLPVTWVPIDTAFAPPAWDTLSATPADAWIHSGLVLGRVRLSCFNHLCRRSRKLP
jgi:hypothetical protein